jgi:hypothetical protein
VSRLDLAQEAHIDALLAPKRVNSMTRSRRAAVVVMSTRSGVVERSSHADVLVMEWQPLQRPRSSRVLAVLAGVLVFGALASAGPASAFQNNPANGPGASADGVDPASRCSPATTRTITGTLTGADGMFVNATLGFDLTDGQGHTFDLGTGCKANGYSTILQLNHGIGGEGAPAGTAITEPDGSAGTVSSSFTIRDIPADVVNAWIEVYPRTQEGNPYPTCGWSCAGPVDTHKYGGLNRREVPIDGTVLHLTEPLTPAFGGTSGGLRITVVNGSAPYTAPVRAYAWSMLTPEGSQPDQGWGFGSASGPAGNVWTFPSLGSGQDYRSRFYLDPNGAQFVEVQHVHVDPGVWTSYTLDVSKVTVVNGRGTFDLTTIPARAVSIAAQGRSSFRCSHTQSGPTVTLRCTLPNSVKLNTHADVSYFDRGQWIRFTVKQVNTHHKVVLSARMRYSGIQQWRVHAGRYNNRYLATGT